RGMLVAVGCSPWVSCPFVGSRRNQPLAVRSPHSASPSSCLRSSCVAHRRGLAFPAARDDSLLCHACLTLPFSCRPAALSLLGLSVASSEAFRFRGVRSYFVA